MPQINSIRLLVVTLFLFGQSIFADEVSAKKEVPYKLIEGNQYEICNALLPFINTVPHGTLRDQPELLEKVKDFKLPEWRQVKDKKYIDLFLNEARSPQEFSKEKYPENYAKIVEGMNKDEIRFYVARFDVDNTGVKRSVLRQDSIKDGKVSGLLYRFSYFVYDDDTMFPSRQYTKLISGSAVLFKGRTFRLEEWPDVWDNVHFWSVGVAEPYYDSNRPQLTTPPEKITCKFSAK